MTELYDPLAHEPLVDGAWDPERVAAAIREIVADAEASFDDGWPNHARDDDRDRPFSTVYLGGAGVVQALDSLQRRGLVELRRDYVPYLERPYEPDYFDRDTPRSLWMGETGIRLVLHRLSPSAENADRLAELIAANAEDERCEVMWGSPGTMLAAAAMHDLTGETRWLELWRESAAWLRSGWDPETGLWTQHLYGRVEQFIGPAHGFAGCVLALSRDGDAEFHRRAAEAMRRWAIEDGGLANWLPTTAMKSLRANGDGSIRLQWCHGSPGMVASLAHVAPGDDEHERLLLAGGELTWLAGPLVKGANLCHGTAGNGYAFLALFERTGDELWLVRARAFAMHAAAQVERGRAELGGGRYTPWTGDAGTALYLADCLAGGGAVPTSLRRTERSGEVSDSLKSIGAITLFVEDPQRSKSFYRDVFDLPVVYEDANSAVIGFENTIVNLLSASAAHGLIDPGTVAGREAGSRFQFTIWVDDADAVCAELATRGVELLNGPLNRDWGMRTASFTDPDGHIWEVAQQLPAGD